LAHIERLRVKAAVNWGGPIHYYFQSAWQRKALQRREYLFGLFEARSALYGVNTLEAFKWNALKTLDII
jgi:esterase FrsA